MRCAQTPRLGFRAPDRRFQRAAFPLRRLAGEHFLVDYLEQPNGTQGYLLNRRAARRLLDYTAGMAHAIDQAIDREWEHGVNIMGVVPGRSRTRKPSRPLSAARPSRGCRCARS